MRSAQFNYILALFPAIFYISMSYINVLLMINVVYPLLAEKCAEMGSEHILNNFSKITPWSGSRIALKTPNQDQKWVLGVYKGYKKISDEIKISKNLSVSPPLDTPKSILWSKFEVSRVFLASNSSIQGLAWFWNIAVIWLETYLYSFLTKIDSKYICLSHNLWFKHRFLCILMVSCAINLWKSIERWKSGRKLLKYGQT